VKTDVNTVKHMARLAKLKLTDQEAAALAEDLSSLFAELNNIRLDETTGQCETTAQKLDIAQLEGCALRKDEPDKFPYRTELLQSMKHIRDDYAVMPRTLNPDGGWDSEESKHDE
jgi:aspartyl/glutamyl-tRNA(Asn/Gln) amidotransferase C subunit